MADSWGHGTTLGYSATVGGGSYTTIATVIEMDSRKLKREPIKTTLLGSARNTHTHRAGMVMPDPYKFRIQYDKTVHATLLAFVDADSPLHDWKVTLTDGSTDIFTGFIAEFDEVPKASNDGVYENDIVIQPTGAGTFTAG